jgi:hypothetical protein
LNFKLAAHQTTLCIKQNTHVLLAVLYSLWENWLGKTKRFVANSTIEMVTRLFAKLIKRGNTMGFSRVVQLGNAGYLTLSEEAGVASVKVAVGADLGGGEAAGVLKAQASCEVDMAVAQFAQLALDLLKSKLPASAQSLISDLEAVAIPALKNL